MEYVKFSELPALSSAPVGTIIPVVSEGFSYTVPSSGFSSVFHNHTGTDLGTPISGNLSACSNANATTLQNGTISGTVSIPDTSTKSTFRTELKVPASDITGITGADAVANMVSLTTAEYTALSSKDAATLYFLT